MSGNDVEQFITVHKLTLMIDHDQPVGVSVQRDADIRVLVQHDLLQALGLRGAAAVIDIETVRFHADRMDFGAQFFKYPGSNPVGRAVGAIDYHANSAQVTIDPALAVLYVPARRIRNPARLAQLVRFNNHDRVGQLLFYL